MPAPKHPTGGRWHHPDFSGLQTGTERAASGRTAQQTADRTRPPDPNIHSDSSTRAPRSSREPRNAAVLPSPGRAEASASEHTHHGRLRKARPTA